MFITFVDDGPGPKRFPWANTILILLNILVCVKTAGRSNFGGILSTFGFIPSRPFGFGFLTGPFLHTSWTTLAASMTFLFMFGRTVEDRIGPRNYVLTYLFCAWVSEATHWYFNPHATLPLVGSTRLVTGMGVFFFLINPWGKMKWVFSFFGVPVFEAPSRTLFVFGLWALFIVCLTWIPIDLIKSMVSFFDIPLLDTRSTARIAWWAHGGAALAGAFLFLVIPKRKGAPKA